MTDRSGNVYENKGLVFHSPMESGNVIENKDSYQLRAGILLKTQHVSCNSPSRSVRHDGPSRFRRPCASGSRVGPGLAPAWPPRPVAPWREERRPYILIGTVPGRWIGLRRTRGIMTTHEVMSVAPLGHEVAVWTIGVTKGAIQGGARARKSGSFRCRSVAASL